MQGEVDLWIKLAYSAMLAVIVPVYIVSWGWRNFLWFSDIALIGTGIALWLESSLLASMMALAVLLPELVWNASYFGRLLFGAHVTDLAGYMFDPGKSRFVRALSLFHVVLPVVLLWLLHELGYDPRALPAQTVLAWLVLPLTYAVTTPADENINWVRGFGDTAQTRVPPRLWLAMLMAAFPLVLYLPTHFVLQRVFGP
ncbi:hypothetical protein [Piscinibacter sp. XHJ-5]|uniref:hypothetical protein n=1 Tax=Piscinibacter sp. XHJ-5 TaxID=3037797 RepID=UPI00245370C9|nr:hypothetical protein [Piscinibacter sp. XHJ-5]